MGIFKRKENIIEGSGAKIKGGQARAQEFTQGERKFKIKSFCARRFFSPPPEKFSPTLKGGGEIFPEGAKRKYLLLSSMRDFFRPPPPERGVG